MFIIRARSSKFKSNSNSYISKKEKKPAAINEKHKEYINTEKLKVTLCNKMQHQQFYCLPNTNELSMHWS